MQYALLAVGFSLLFSTARFYAFTYGFCFTAGAYGVLAICQWTGCPIMVAIGGGCLVAVAFGVALESALYRYLRKHNAGSLALMLASIGAYVVLQNCISMLFGDATRSLRTWPVQAGFELMGARITGIQLCNVVAAATLILAIGALMATTRMGGVMRAAASDACLAECSGIDINRTILVTTILASFLAGMAGVLIGLDIDLTPTMGFRALLVAIVACVIGGLGRLSGPALGGLLLGLVEHLVIWKVSSQWQDAVVFGALILVLLARPRGLFGGFPRTWRP